MSRPAPIVIIGAGRSGTNMLRDILVQIPGLVTWPCDEINYIWRHGNRAYPNDEFTREMATPTVRKFIKRQFDRLTRAQTVVEKTCANSLRVGFVDEVLPEARFIHIVRDGRDVCVSAGDRWTAKLDMNYIIKKARYVPLSDLPFYGSSYFGNRLRRLFSKDQRLAVWGPKFLGMERAFQENSLPVACAIQWKACVDSATHQLSSIDPQRVFSIRYEDFAEKPLSELQRINQFLKIELADSLLESMIGGVSRKSVGRWQTILNNDDLVQIHKRVGATLISHGYQLDRID